MIEVTAATPWQKEYICERLAIYPSAQFKAIVQMKYGKIVAATGYDNWTPNSVQMHIWIPGQMSRFFVKESFRYPFEIANKKLAIGVIPEDNAASLRFAQRIGFKPVHRVEDGWSDGVALIVLQMRREDCRWSH